MAIAIDEKVLPKDILLLKKLSGYDISSYRDFHEEEKLQQCKTKYPLIAKLNFLNSAFNPNTPQV